MAKADNHEGTIQKVYHKDGSFVFRCRIYVGDAEKKFIYGTAKTQREARAIAKANFKLYKRQKESAHPDPKKKSNQPVSTVMDEFLQITSLAENWKASSLMSRQGEADCIYKYIGSKKVSELSASVCNKCLVDMLQDYHRHTVRKCRNLLERFIKYSCEEGFILEDFSKQIKRIKITDNTDIVSDECLIFTGEEIDSIKDLAENEYIEYNKTIHNLQYKALILYVLFLTGMRPQELRALTTDDIDFVNHRISITKARTRIKGGETDATPKTRYSKRIIGINQHTEQCFAKLIELQPVKSKYICITETNTRLTSRNLFDWFESVLRYAGIDKNGRAVRSLRHTFISMSIDKDKHSPLWNLSIPRISRYVGHSKLSTTMDVYTQVHPEHYENIDYDETKIELVDIEYDIEE